MTEEQISALNEALEDFVVGSYEVREKIVEDFLDRFQGAYPKGAQFDHKGVETVRTVSAASGCSHTFFSLFGSTFTEKRSL